MTECPRCGGNGGWKGWPGFTCYLCGGTGQRPVVTREERARIKAGTCRSCGRKPGQTHQSYCAHKDEVVGNETPCTHSWCQRVAEMASL